MPIADANVINNERPTSIIIASFTVVADCCSVVEEELANAKIDESSMTIVAICNWYSPAMYEVLNSKWYTPGAHSVQLMFSGSSDE